MAGSYKGLSLCIINGVSVGVGKQQRGWHDSKNSRRLTQSTIQKTLCIYNSENFVWTYQNWRKQMDVSWRGISAFIPGTGLLDMAAFRSKLMWLLSNWPCPKVNMNSEFMKWDNYTNYTQNGKLW